MVFTGVKTQSIRRHRNIAQTVVVQNTLNSVIQTITDYMQVQILVATPPGEFCHTKGQRHTIKKSVKLVQINLKETNLLLHALMGRNMPIHPLLFQVPPLRRSKGLKQGICYIQRNNSPVEITEYSPAIRNRFQHGQGTTYASNGSVNREYRMGLPPENQHTK